MFSSIATTFRSWNRKKNLMALALKQGCVAKAKTMSFNIKSTS